MEQPTNEAGNPQASLCDLSWLGGIVDGEGCLTVNKRNPGPRATKQCVAPMVTVVNTDRRLTNKVEEILRLHQIGFYVAVHPKKGNWKEKIEITISGLLRVQKFLTLIRPYLVSKAEKAVLLLEFCKSRDGKRGAYSEDEKSICRRIWELNGRGTSHW